MVRHAANSILTMGLDGRSIKQSDLQADASNFSTEFEAQETQDNQIDIPDRKGVSGQLIPTEEVAFGHVGVSACTLTFVQSVLMTKCIVLVTFSPAFLRKHRPNCGFCLLFYAFHVMFGVIWSIFWRYGDLVFGKLVEAIRPTTSI